MPGSNGSEKLSQSGVILTYLAETTGRFGGGDDRERREILKWILFDNHKFTSYLASYRFMRTFTRTGDPAVMDFLKGRITGAFGIVEKHLAAQPFIAGARPTIADFSMCGYLFFPPEELGFDLAAEFPAMHAWTDRIRTLPGWVHPYQLMPGHPLPESP